MQVDAIRTAVSAATEQMQTMARWGSDDFYCANQDLRQLHAAGQLTEDVLSGYLTEGSFDKIALALSIMCEIPIGAVERAMAHGRYEQTMLFAKALELSWRTTLALMQFQAGENALPQAEVDQRFTSFNRMQVKTAKTALQFYRLRESSIKSPIRDAK